jgi:hypothetical protein
LYAEHSGSSVVNSSSIELPSNTIFGIDHPIQLIPIGLWLDMLITPLGYWLMAIYTPGFNVGAAFRGIIFWMALLGNTEYQELLDNPNIAREPAVSRPRIGELLALMQTLSAWTDEMLRSESAILVKIMKLGACIQNLWRR